MRRIAAFAAMSALASSAYAADAFRPPVAPGWGQSVTGDLEAGWGKLNAPGGTSLNLFTTTARVDVAIAGSLNFEGQVSANALSVTGLSTQWSDAYGHFWARLPSSAWGVF